MAEDRPAGGEPVTWAVLARRQSLIDTMVTDMDPQHGNGRPLARVLEHVNAVGCKDDDEKEAEFFAIAHQLVLTLWFERSVNSNPNHQSNLSAN